MLQVTITVLIREDLNMQVINTGLRRDKFQAFMDPCIIYPASFNSLFPCNQ